MPSSQEASIAHKIKMYSKDRDKKPDKDGDGLSVNIRLAQKVDLEGDELEEFEQKYSKGSKLQKSPSPSRGV